MKPRISFYTDEHVSKAVVYGLRRRGINVLRVVDTGTLGADDSEHLDRARQERRVIVVTRDDDFLRLHASGIVHAGIAYLPQAKTTGEIIRGLLLIHDLLTPDEMLGHVEFL